MASFRLTSRIFCATIAGLFACFVLDGCHSPASPPLAAVHLAPVSARASQSPLADVQAVQSLPLYRQAQQLCRERQYRKAADLLARLADSSGLSPEQRAFCLQQQRICLNHFGAEGTNGTQGTKGSYGNRFGSHSPTAYSLLPTASLSSDCGPRALLLVCQSLHVPASLPALTKAAGTSDKGTNFVGLQAAAKSVSLKAEAVQVSREALPDIAVPAIAWTNGNHFVQIVRFSGRGESGTVIIHDPNKPQPETLQQEQFLQQCGGYLLLLKK